MVEPVAVEVLGATRTARPVVPFQHERPGAEFGRCGKTGQPRAQNQKVTLLHPPPPARRRSAACYSVRKVSRVAPRSLRAGGRSLPHPSSAGGDGPPRTCPHAARGGARG